MVCVPSGVTDVERRAVRRVALDLGAKEVFTIEEPIAAAIGAGMDIAQPYGSLIVDIGGGTADIAVVSMGQCVVSESLKVAGDRMNDAIVRFLRRKHNLLIGERTAELLKINIGTAYPRSETLYTEVMGRNLLTGLQKCIQISSEDIRFAHEEELNLLIQGIHKVLESNPSGACRRYFGQRDLPYRRRLSAVRAGQAVQRKLSSQLLCSRRRHFLRSARNRYVFGPYGQL